MTAIPVIIGQSAMFIPHDGFAKHGPEEIDIAFAFGYPQSDSVGNVTVPFTDSVPAGEPGAVPWLRAFPRRLVLQPGQQQVVRILAQPPENLPDGEYWGRVMVASIGGQPPIQQQQPPPPPPAPDCPSPTRWRHWPPPAAR